MSDTEEEDGQCPFCQQPWSEHGTYPTFIDGEAVIRISLLAAGCSKILPARKWFSA